MSQVGKDRVVQRGGTSAVNMAWSNEILRSSYFSKHNNGKGKAVCCDVEPCFYSNKKLDLDRRWVICKGVLFAGCNAYMMCDGNLSCYGELTDAEILETVADNPVCNNEEEAEEEVENIMPSTSEILQSIQNLRAYFLALNKFNIELEWMEEDVIKNTVTMQTKITDFFKLNP